MRSWGARPRPAVDWPHPTATAPPGPRNRRGRRACRTPTRGPTVGIVVQKYGGSSLADADAIKRVARRIVEVKKSGHDVVVAVSAMGDTTDDLLDLAAAVTPLPPARELDMLQSAGERISMALVAMAISDLGFTARSFTGSQAGVITDAQHGKAKIIDVTPGRVTQAIGEGHIVIVAGFQGVSADTKEITTLGRGGSDTTAVALAAALEADVCEIYTDVDGVFTADPASCPPPASSRASPTRRCSSWPRADPRSCTCAAWSTAAATASRSTSARRSASSRGRGSPTPPPRRNRGRDHGTAHHRRGRPRRQRGQDHRRRRARQGRRGRPHLRGAGRRADQPRHDRAERLGGRDQPHRHLLHPAPHRRPDRDDGAARIQAEVGYDKLLYDDKIG